MKMKIAGILEVHMLRRSVKSRLKKIEKISAVVGYNIVR